MHAWSTFVYLFLVKSLKSRSHTRWCLQMVRQMVRLTCSYQHAIDAPNAIGGHTRRGATRRITYCVAAPASSSGTGKYGCLIMMQNKKCTEFVSAGDSHASWL